jgi:hypothetical protein
VGHTSRSSSLPCVKASRDMVFQSGPKTGRGATVSCARGTIMEAVLSPS